MSGGGCYLTYDTTKTIFDFSGVAGYLVWLLIEHLAVSTCIASFQSQRPHRHNDQAYATHQCLLCESSATNLCCAWCCAALREESARKQELIAALLLLSTRIGAKNKEQRGRGCVRGARAEGAASSGIAWGGIAWPEVRGRATCTPLCNLLLS